MSRRYRFSLLPVQGTSPLYILGVDRVGGNVKVRSEELRMQGKYWVSQMGDGFYVESERSSWNYK